MSDSAKLRMIQIVLHWAWDPIGVRGISEAFDEYDMYASQILELLQADAPREDIAALLATIVPDRLGMPTEPDKDSDVSELLRQLYALGR